MPPTADRSASVLVVGAGPCGLAIARQLRHAQGIDALVVDAAPRPAWSWRNRYDGFRLNTCGWWSHLPGQRIPLSHGRWPSRDDMVAYFDDYVSRQGLRLTLGVKAIRLDRLPDGRWRLATDTGALTTGAVVVATGNYHTPALPDWPGSRSFTGELTHSAHYRNAVPYTGRDVLVVGAGNSAVDIALQVQRVAARVRMAVRTPPHLVPRAAAGIPIDAFSPVFTVLPDAVLDHTAALASRLWFGDLTERGLPAPRRGALTALREDEQIPTLGDDLVPHVKAGRIGIVAAVESFDGRDVGLADGSVVRPDAVIAATGYRRGLESLVGHLGAREGVPGDLLDEHGKPVRNGVPSAAPGLWFAGYDEPLIGPLQSFRREATPIAKAVRAHLDSRAARVSD